MYTKVLYAGWGDMDFNSHMRNTAYLDKTADVRQMHLAEHGFPVEEFSRLRIGPVVMRDEIEYFNEVKLQEKITIAYLLAGHAPDGSRFLLRHEISDPMESSAPGSPVPEAGWIWINVGSWCRHRLCYRQ